MSDEDEMEEFSMNNEDLMRAMNPNFKRNRQTKEESMLGIWASREYSGDEDEEEVGFRGRKKKSSTINFVSSRTKRRDEAEKKIEEEKENNEMIMRSSEEEEEDSDIEEKIISKRADDIILGHLDDIEEEEVKLTKKIESQVQPPKPKQAKVKPAEVFVDRKAAKEIGTWEKHTKGIGAKLLAKMGWEKGKGIGKDMQGRAVPVEATVRKGKAAVGAYGAETKELRKKQREAAGEEEEDEENEEESRHVSQWRKDRKNKKPHYQLRTPEELLELAAKNPSKLKRMEKLLGMGEGSQVKTSTTTNKIKIIDMTGKEQRVVHGYEAISQLTSSASAAVHKEKKKFDLPELMHNLDILINFTEDKILNHEKKCKHLEDSLVSLRYEEKRSKERINAEDEQIKKLKEISAIIDKMEVLAEEENADLSLLINMYESVHEKYPDEFLIFDLCNMAVPLFTPFLKRKMQQWRPFAEDAEDAESTNSDLLFCFEHYSTLKSLLKDHSQKKGQSESSMPPFHRILWETWIPAFRSLLTQISIRTYSIECVDLLNSWAAILPQWMFTYIHEQLILPKLTIEVDKWNPLTDTVPIHKWIHPWLPTMKNVLDSTLIPQIRFKLGKALSNWHPSDASAKAILLPWKPPAFTASTWEAFMSRNIVPKLELVLSGELVINPAEQNLEPWFWVSSWQELISSASFESMLERVFFPKWFKVLSVWLNSASPDYEEVMRWHSGWKSLMGERLLQQEGVNAKLRKGTEMIFCGISGAHVVLPGDELKPQQQTKIETEPIRISDSSEPLKARTHQIKSFKDVVEAKATEHNLLFLPVPNRIVDGKQVYRFGNLNVYIDKNVLFMLQNGAWRPTNLNEVLQKAL